jgi:hypothetical protein
MATISIENPSNPKYDVMEVRYAAFLGETEKARQFAGWDGARFGETAWVSKAQTKHVDEERKLVYIPRWLYEGIMAKEGKKEEPAGEEQFRTDPADVEGF